MGSSTSFSIPSTKTSWPLSGRESITTGMSSSLAWLHLLGLRMAKTPQWSPTTGPSLLCALTTSCWHQCLQSAYRQKPSKRGTSLPTRLALLEAGLSMNLSLESPPGHVTRMAQCAYWTLRRPMIGFSTNGSLDAWPGLAFLQSLHHFYKQHSKGPPSKWWPMALFPPG